MKYTFITQLAILLIAGDALASGPKESDVKSLNKKSTVDKDISVNAKEYGYSNDLGGAQNGIDEILEGENSPQGTSDKTEGRTIGQGGFANLQGFGGAQGGFGGAQGGAQEEFGGAQGGAQEEFGGAQVGFGGFGGFGGAQGGAQGGFGGGFGGAQGGFGGGFGGAQGGFGGPGSDGIGGIGAGIGFPGAIGGSSANGVVDSIPPNSIYSYKRLPLRYLKFLGTSANRGYLMDVYTEDDVSRSFLDGKIGNRPDGTYQRNRMSRATYIGGARIPYGSRGCSSNILEWTFKHTIGHLTVDGVDIADMAMHGDFGSLGDYGFEFLIMHTVGLIEDVFNLINPLNLANSVVQLAGGKKPGYCIVGVMEKWEDSKRKKWLGLNHK